MKLILIALLALFGLFRTYTLEKRFELLESLVFAQHDTILEQNKLLLELSTDQ